MRNLSTSIYTFEKLRQENCVYVDKTEYLYKLVTGASQQVFCARPRRFGKSLTVSTLEAIFRGKRELFEGLYIGAQDYDWQEHPVVRIDFARMDITNLRLLQSSLSDRLQKIAEDYNLTIRGKSSAQLFSSLVEGLYESRGRGVVILIDEYDKPIFEHIEEKEAAEEFRRFLSSFYQIIKGAEAQERFVFLTGVTRLAKLSVFSKLNNLLDISMDKTYATMMGYTQAELEENFSDRLDVAAGSGVRDEYGTMLDREGIVAGLKRWYDGFCFVPGAESVYNPVSVGNFFLQGCEFNSYWFATGTPRFLIELMQRNHLTLVDVAAPVLTRNSMDSFDIADLAGTKVETPRILELLCQTGYLTIDAEMRRGLRRAYRMRFPNLEVASAFEENLLAAYAGSDDSWVDDFSEYAMAGDTVGMMKIMESAFAAIPYDIQLPQEKYYQSLVFMMCHACGMDVQAEVATNIGRIDAVLRAGQHIYIMEFKLDKTAGAALVQIDEKKYTQKYILPARKKGQVVHKLGINFSYAKEDRNITDWQEEIVR